MPTVKLLRCFDSAHAVRPATRPAIVPNPLKGESVKILTLRSVITSFLEWSESALAPATVDAYRHQLGKFLRATKNKRVENLRPMHLSRWAKTWHEAQAVIRLFNWAVKEAKLLKKNPFGECRLPARDQRRLIISRMDIARLLRSAGRAARRYLIALRETIARPQEIRLARWAELQTEDMETPIDDALRQGKALIIMHNFKDKSKRQDSSRPRVLLISRRLGRLILRISRRTVTREGFIFLNHLGSPWTKNAVRIMMRRLRRKLGWVADARGENKVAYTLRHSMLTLLASRMVPDRTLADLGGHVETRTVSRYLHLQVGHLRDAMKRMWNWPLPR